MEESRFRGLTDEVGGGQRFVNTLVHPGLKQIDFLNVSKEYFLKKLPQNVIVGIQM